MENKRRLAKATKRRNTEIGPEPEVPCFRKRLSKVIFLSLVFLSFPSLGCQLQASYLQHHLKGGHFIQVEWYDYHLDPARAAGVVDLRFNKPARQAFETWSETLLSAPATSATGEIFRPGGRLVFQDFDGNITEVFLPNDNINKLCKIKDLYFTQDQKLLEKAMVYLTLPASSPAGKP